MSAWLVIGLVVLAGVIGWLLHRKSSGKPASTQALKSAVVRRAAAEKAAKEKQTDALREVRKARAKEVERLVRDRDALHDRLDDALGEANKGGDPPTG